MDAIDSCRRKVRRKYRGRPYCEDLEQEAAIGVLRAAEDYDPDRGATFMTHAYWHAMGKARRHYHWRQKHGTGRTFEEVWAGAAPRRSRPKEIPAVPVEPAGDSSLSVSAKKIVHGEWRKIDGEMADHGTSRTGRLVFLRLAECIYLAGDTGPTDIARIAEEASVSAALVRKYRAKLLGRIKDSGVIS